MEADYGAANFNYPDKSIALGMFEQLDAIQDVPLDGEFTYDWHIDWGMTGNFLKDVPIVVGLWNDLLQGHEQGLKDFLSDPTNYIKGFGTTAIYHIDTEKQIQFRVGVDDFKSIDDWDQNTYGAKIIIPQSTFQEYIDGDAQIYLQRKPGGSGNVELEGGVKIQLKRKP